MNIISLLFVCILSINFISAFSLGDAFDFIGDDLTLIVAFAISFTLIYWALSRFFKDAATGRTNKGIPAIISLALSFFITKKVNDLNLGLSFGNAAVGAGIPSEAVEATAGIIGLVAIIVALIFLRWTIVLISGLLFIIIGLFGGIDANPVFVIIGIILVLLWFFMFKKDDEDEAEFDPDNPALEPIEKKKPSLELILTLLALGLIVSGIGWVGGFGAIALGILLIIFIFFKNWKKWKMTEKSKKTGGWFKKRGQQWEDWKRGKQQKSFEKAHAKQRADEKAFKQQQAKDRKIRLGQKHVKSMIKLRKIALKKFHKQIKTGRRGEIDAMYQTLKDRYDPTKFAHYGQDAQNIAIKISHALDEMYRRSFAKAPGDDGSVVQLGGGSSQARQARIQEMEQRANAIIDQEMAQAQVDQQRLQQEADAIRAAEQSQQVAPARIRRALSDQEKKRRKLVKKWNARIKDIKREINRSSSSKKSKKLAKKRLKLVEAKLQQLKNIRYL